MNLGLGYILPSQFMFKVYQCFYPAAILRAKRANIPVDMITSNNKSPSNAKFVLSVKVCVISVRTRVSSDVVHHLGFYLGYTCLLSDLAPFPTSVVLGEPPPPYSPQGSPDSSSAPVINCRVCQSAISVEGKMHQHVVKCGICNEATVSQTKHVFQLKTN